MLKIQMQRTGRRNDPAFRIVVGEHTMGPKSGKFKEKLGSHHPKTKQTSLDSERIKYWLSVGAKATGRVHNLLISEGVIEGKKVNVLPKHTPIKTEQPAEEAAPAAAAATSEESAAETTEAATEESAEDTSSEAGADAPATEDAAPEEAAEAPAAEEAPTTEGEEAKAAEGSEEKKAA